MRDLKKSTNSLETKRIRKILNEESRLGISPNSDSETDEVDLQKELYPLGHYIDNREEMIEQMFSVIKGAKLRKMLPPILKDIPYDELKADCLIHLLGMSKKRIQAILDGKEINSSSESELQSDSSTTPSKKPKVDLKPFVIKQEGCSDISDNSEEVVLVDPDLDFLNVTCNDKTKENTTEVRKKAKRKLKKKDLDKKYKRPKAIVIEQTSESDEVEPIESSAESVSENEAKKEVPTEGKTLLEILELEMRARAIRALLKNNDPQEGGPQKPVESPTQNPTNSKEKPNKHSKEGITEKITPAKNFRKKKKKSDDVIVIAPKLVTIDLTDENEQQGCKGNDDTSFSSQNSSLVPPQTSNKINKINLSDTPTLFSKEFPSKKIGDCSEDVAVFTDEKTSKSDSLNKSAEPANSRSSWTQRWLESKEVKKVVSTSKICGNIRKKIKNAKLAKKQMQVQDEPVNPSTAAPQQKMVGSVNEYELLSKTKTSSDMDSVTDNETQASVSSAIQEPTCTDTDFNEISTADQVQDVSSTKAENSSGNFLQDNALEPQLNKEKPVSNQVESDDGVNIINVTLSVQDNVTEVLSSNLDDGGTDISNRSNGGVRRIEFNSSDKKVENNGNDDIYSEPEPKTTACETENREKDNLKLPRKRVVNKKSETKYSEASKVHLKNFEEVNDSLSNNENRDDYVDKSDDAELNIENQVVENYLLEVPETTKHEGSKPIQELNEPETLEINITDEDRTIENVIEENNEQNQTKDLKDNVTVIN